MAIRAKDRKILWGLSGNRCLLCGEVLIRRTEEGSYAVVGEEGHIVSASRIGPRYSEIEPPGGYDHYSNLVLLCTTHHKKVDIEQPEDYPAWKLLRMKARHEAAALSVSEAVFDAGVREAPRETVERAAERGLNILQLQRWKDKGGRVAISVLPPIAACFLANAATSILRGSASFVMMFMVPVLLGLFVSYPNYLLSQLFARWATKIYAKYKSPKEAIYFEFWLAASLCISLVAGWVIVLLRTRELSFAALAVITTVLFPLVQVLKAVDLFKGKGK